MKKIKHTFRLTDMVRIVDELPSTMSHFTSGEDAIIVERNDDEDKYALHIKHKGYSAWYHAEHLTFIKHNQSELLDKWEAGKYGKKKKKERKIPDELRNFTAILPGTCNADCSFCPEKEMEQKAGQKMWQNNLIKMIKTHGHRVDHVSLSGGEPTLRMKYLFETIDRIQQEAHMRTVGLTSNGQFLEKQSQILTFLDLNTNDMLESKLAHLNISMHSFDRDLANKIMGVKYTWTLEDLARFRRQLGRKLSFHINFVINDKNIKNIEWEFKQANEFMKKNQWIDVVFRVDYNNKKLSKELRNYGLALEEYRNATRGSHRDVMEAEKNLKKKPQILDLFDTIFDGSYYDELTEETLPGFNDSVTNACPSCFTHRSTDLGNSFAYLKASSYEPNEDEEEFTEMVFHMDGNLYFDWSRKDPVPEVAEKKRKPLPRLKTSKRKEKVVQTASECSVASTRCGFVTPGSCNYGGSRCGY